MVEVKEGEVLNLNASKRGSGDKGAWMLIKKVEGKKSIDIWAENAEEAKDWQGLVKVKKILSLKSSARKWQDKWYEVVSCNVELARMSEQDVYKAQKDATSPFSEAAFMDVPASAMNNDMPFA